MIVVSSGNLYRSAPPKRMKVASSIVKMIARNCCIDGIILNANRENMRSSTGSSIDSIIIKKEFPCIVVSPNPKR